MAVRVRKLARELDRGTEDVLQLLRDLGIDRFRTEDDMLPDPVADQVRKAARSRPPRAMISSAARADLVTPSASETLVPASRRDTGIPPARRGEATASPSTAPTAAPSSAAASDADLMAMLVPGVVRVGERRKSTAAPASVATVPPRNPRPEQRSGSERSKRTAPPDDLQVLAARPGARDERREALEAAHAELQRLRAEGEALRAALTTATAAVQEQEEQLGRLQAELYQANARLDEIEAHPPLPVGITLQQMLEERGLRGADEAERAVAALSAAHLFGKLLGTLLVGDVGAVRRLLSERLVLFGGPVPEGLAYAAVTVSAERADIPGAEALQRTLGRIGELSLLNGCRRVLVVGVAPKWQTLVREGVDRRVELVFRASVGEEPGRIDLVVVWTNQDPTASDARTRRIDVRAASLGDFLERWATALAG